MIKNIILLISFQTISLFGTAQITDSISYKFDTVIEYQEEREHDDKTYKIFLFTNSNNPDTHLLAYYKDSSYFLTLKGKAPRIDFNTKLNEIESVNDVVIMVDGVLENYNPTSFFKIDRERLKTKCKTKVHQISDSIISSESKIKVYFKSKEKGSQLAVKQELHFAYNREQIPLEIFTWYSNEISDDVNGKTKGLMTYFKDGYDGEAKGEIELNLVQVKKHDLKLTLKKT